MDGLDLVFTVIGTGETLRVRDHFLGDLIDPLFGRNFADDTGVASISFADGTIWNWYDMAFAVSHPDDDSDLVVGTESRDVLQGGRGNDVLRGGRDGDIYIFRVGDGQDRIIDANDRPTDDPETKMDLAMFLGGIVPEDIRYERDGESNDVRMVVLDTGGVETGDVITIEDQFGWINIPFIGLIFADAVERVVFDGTSFLTRQDIMARVLADARTDGADIIYGFHNVDVLEGGPGDDVLIGREQNDTYVFGLGYGHDVIRDEARDLFSASYDTLRFTGDLRWTSFDFLRDGDSATVALRVTGTSDQVTLSDQYKSFPFLGFNNMVEEIVFAEGTVWDYARLAQHVIDLSVTSGNDTIYGFEIGDILYGDLGDDRLEGGLGGDTYRWGPGTGSDRILDAGSGEASDTLELSGIAVDDVTIGRIGRDLVLTLKAGGETLTIEAQYNRDGQQANAIEYFVFSDITVDFRALNPDQVDVVGSAAAETLHGSDFAERLDGRAGNDRLVGGSDGDRYLFDLGYGEDLIIDQQVRAVWTDRDGRRGETDDVVQFGAGIARGDLVFTRDGDDLLISITGNNADTLRVQGQFNALSMGVERFEFADASFLHRSDIEEILQIAGGNWGANEITGSENAPNVLDGRAGDDTLTGGRAADIYAFDGGYDIDRIIESDDPVALVVDRVVFGQLVSPDSLRVLREGDDLILDLVNGHDRLTVVGGFAGRQVEEFWFADGTIWTLEHLRERLLAGTDGDDVLRGFDDRADVLTGGAGSDALEGGLGADSYHFGSGDGADSILDSGGIDQVVFGAGVTAAVFSKQGDDLLVQLADSRDSLIIVQGTGATSNRIESFVFADGGIYTAADVDRILVLNQSTFSDDVIDARVSFPIRLDTGPGNDLIRAGSGATLVHRAGNGSDIIDTRGQSGSSTLEIADYGVAGAVVRVRWCGCWLSAARMWRSAFPKAGNNWSFWVARPMPVRAGSSLPMAPSGQGPT